MGVVVDSQESEESPSCCWLVMLVMVHHGSTFSVKSEDIQIVSTNITRSVSIRCLARKEVLSDF